jgi:hypothetical protein
MSSAMDDIQGTTTKLLRRRAQQYAEELNRYGVALAHYGEGKADLADVARAGLDAAWREARGTVEFGVAMTEALYRWSAGLVGIRFAESKSTPSRKSRGAKDA